jgi:phage terminase large subunit-like protein
MLSARNEFLTKRLNVWVNAATAWMNMLQWDDCADTTLSLEDFAGEPCWIGMDLAEKNDFAALALVFRRGEDYYAFSRLYLNRFAADESGNSQLAGWEEAGWITINEGNVTDFDQIKQDLRGYAKRFDVQEVPFDPAKAMYFASKLIEEGFPMIEVRQNGAFFTQPVIQTENMVLEKKFHFDGNPALTWMVSNVVIQTSHYTQLKHPTKENEANKIDGAVAMFMAVGRAMVATSGHSQVFINLNETV